MEVIEKMLVRFHGADQEPGKSQAGPFQVPDGKIKARFGGRFKGKK